MASDADVVIFLAKQYPPSLRKPEQFTWLEDAIFINGLLFKDLASFLKNNTIEPAQVSLQQILDADLKYETFWVDTYIPLHKETDIQNLNYWREFFAETTHEPELSTV